MSTLWTQYQVGLVGFLSAVLVIVLSNLRALRRMGSYPAPERLPSVSILLPVRNEQEDVASCVRSLLAQDYPHFEVLVLDDQSTDRTRRILAALERESRRLHVLEGRPTPSGWLGKPWACHQLAQAATGGFFLFTDADTRHHPLALRDAIAAALTEGADMLTALPKQEVVSWAEQLIVPIFQWGFFSFLPLALAHRLPAPALSAAVGQFLLFRRGAYHNIGGHAAVQREVAEDVSLARLVKAGGLRWRMVDGTGRVRCRMYRGAREVIDGFSKNLFPVFDYRLLPFAFIWLWTWAAFWSPLLVWGVRAVGRGLPGPSLLLASIAISESLCWWLLFYWRFRLPLYLALLYPLTVLSFILIAARSVFLTLTGGATWKGRPLSKRQVRWL